MGSNEGAPTGPRERRSEVLGLGRNVKSTSRQGKSRWKGTQAGGADGRLAGRRAEGGGEMALEGLAGPVKRFGLYLTDNAEPSLGFRQGRDMGSLAFSKIAPTTAGRMG